MDELKLLRNKLEKARQERAGLWAERARFRAKLAASRDQFRALRRDGAECLTDSRRAVGIGRGESP